jgi:hypothetical protein
MPHRLDSDSDTEPAGAGQPIATPLNAQPRKRRATKGPHRAFADSSSTASGATGSAPGARQWYLHN